MDNLFIIIPAYNERENIESVIDSWYPIIEKHSGNGASRLVVVNDGSKDNTYEIVKKYAETKPLLVALTKRNGGHGSTVLFGYKYAIDNKADFIFQTDSDGQTNANEFEQFWKLRDKYDAILGNRVSREDGIFRVFTEYILRMVLFVIFHISVPDANAPFRLMRREVVEKYIGKMPEDYNLPNVMLTTYFKYYNERLCFREISFKPRQGGKNSINIKRIVKIGWKALFDFCMLKKEM